MDYGLSSEISADDDRQPRWKQQREDRGFDDTELWNLDSTIANFIHPRLVAFRNADYGYPADFESREEWDVVLDKMIFSFAFYASDRKFGAVNGQKWAKVQEGLNLFAQHFGALWN